MSPSLADLVEHARGCVENGRLASAEVIYQTILDDTVELTSGLQRIARGEACRHFAERAVANVRYGEACDWYHSALMADPLAVEYRLDYVNRALLPIGMLSIARLEARRACEIEPSNAYCWRIAAAVEREVNDAVATQRHLDRAFVCDPTDVATKMFQAAVWADLGKFDEALALFSEVERDRPELTAEVWHNYGIIYDRLDQYDLAIEWMDKAIAAGTLADPVLARWNRAGMLLTVGNYAEGWPAQGVTRNQPVTPRQALALGRSGKRFKAPWFTLETSPCRVHIHPEQGWGDVICMSRYLPAIRDLGHDVRFEVDANMVELFRESPALAGITILPKATDFPGALGLPEFDVHGMTMELPSLFGTTLENIPRAEGWLEVSEERLRHFGAEALRPSGDDKRRAVGLCASSGIREGFWLTEYGKRKSIGRENAERLMAMCADVAWYEFDFDKNPMSFADAAALLKNLDLLVTVDTAIAHLAGALGVPTWLLMHPQGSWHWMTTELFPTTSPWYASIRLFRATQPHEWASVLERVAAELNDLATAGNLI